MSKANVQFRLKGFEEIRRLPKTKDELERRASRIAEHAGEGYEMRSGEGKSRSRASVVTTSIRAINSNRKHNTLIKSMDAGKGS